MKWQYLIILFLVGTMVSCRKKVEPTEVIVEDRIRHYFPVLAGQELKLNYRIKNVGDEPLVISEIQPDCGCIVLDDSKRLIPPDKELLFNFKYESAKNIGYVRHSIRLYGNIKPHGVLELIFDTNVVPSSDFIPDYEEMWYHDLERKRLTKELVNGSEEEQGYYVDVDENARSGPRYPWREEE